MQQQAITNVADLVHAGAPCSGCGACAAVCPKSSLQMKCSEFGRYVPAREESCVECGLCTRVCPFISSNKSSDVLAGEQFGAIPGIDARPECGHYLSSFAGYSHAARREGGSASGGLATWTLETLLSQGHVDKVIAVTAVDAPDMLFCYRVFNDVESIRNCAGSAYYPVHMSEVLRYVLENDGRYAIIGLPCFVSSLRLACEANPKLRDRLVFVAGLVCEGLHTKLFTEYLIRLAKADPGEVRRVWYREKPEGATARDSWFEWSSSSEKPSQSHMIHMGHECGQAGGGAKWFFRLDACNYCDDAFAELADAVFMDAWLPQYEREACGTSLVIARSELADSLLRSGASAGELCLSELSIDEVVASQQPVLAMKRHALSVRLSLLPWADHVEPRLRVRRLREAPSGEKARQVTLLRLQSEAPKAWLASGGDVEAFYRQMPLFRKLVARDRRRAAWNRVAGGLSKRVKRVLGLGQEKGGLRG